MVYRVTAAHPNDQRFVHVSPKSTNITPHSELVSVAVTYVCHTDGAKTQGRGCDEDKALMSLSWGLQD